MTLSVRRGVREAYEVSWLSVLPAGSYAANILAAEAPDPGYSFDGYIDLYAQ